MAHYMTNDTGVLDDIVTNYNLYKALNIADDIKIGRIRWVGHITRMEDERIPKKVLDGKFNNTRPVGKPRTRWEDTTWRDTSEILGT